MDGLIWEPGHFWQFVALTLVAGGMMAYATGRAVAKTWRPVGQVLIYTALLTIAVRFLHYALFEGFFVTWTLLDPNVVHWLAVAILVASLGVALAKIKTPKRLAEVALYAILIIGLGWRIYRGFTKGYVLSADHFGWGLWYWLVTYVVLTGVGVWGYRRERGEQMSRQYSWLSV